MSRFVHTYRHVILLFILTAAVSLYILRAPGYQLGQANDDAHYALLARSLANGQGYIDYALSQDPVASFAPPG